MERGKEGTLVYEVRQGGTYEIRLEATDGVFDTTSVVEKELVVPDVLQLIERAHQEADAKAREDGAVAAQGQEAPQ